VSKLERDQFFEGLDEILQTNNQMLAAIEPDVREQVYKTIDIWQQERAMKREALPDQQSAALTPAERVKPAMPAILRNVYPNVA